MTAREFCEGGNYDVVKGAVHGTLGVLCGACCIYNFAAWCFRGQTHNGVNAVIYFAGTVLEIAHVKHHTREPHGS